MLEGVEGIDDAAADAVFHGNQAVVDVAANDFVKDAGDIAERDVGDAAAEFLHGGGVGECAGRAEKADAQRLFQRERSAHQFAIDRLQASIWQRPMIEPANFLQNHLLPIRRIDRRIMLLLELSDLDDNLGAGVEQIDDLPIELVDLHAKRLKGLVAIGWL